MKGAPTEQPMMAHLVLRAFFDSIFMSAMKNVGHGVFDVEFHASSMKTMDSVEGLFFQFITCRTRIFKLACPKVWICSVL